MLIPFSKFLTEKYRHCSNKGTLIKNQVEIIEGRGKLAGKAKVEVNGKTMAYKSIILATGARWLKPDFPGSDLEEVTTSDYLLKAKKVPKRVLLVGRSPWLIEIAQFLKRFDKESVEDIFLPKEAKDIKTLLKIAYYDPPYVPGFILKDIHKNMFSNQVAEKMKLISTVLNSQDELLKGNYHIPHDTLIIWGQYDPVFPVVIANRLKKSIGENAHLEIIANAAHAPNLEEPQKLNELIAYTKDNA